MAIKSSSTHYGIVAVAIHWLSAALIIAVLGSGFRAASTLDPAAKAQILTVHVPLAISAALLTLARLLWWWLVDRKPDPLKGTPRWQALSAGAVHWLFYIVIFGMAASGIGMFVLSGAGAIVFGGAEGPLPDFWTFKPRVPHGLGARAMLVLLALHAGAALYHHLVLKDGVLKRMWGGTRAG